jgi:uncharacterized protein DUF6455
MHKLGDPMEHTRLMVRMGQALGVDLVAAHDAGDLTQSEWASMVQSCRGCEWGGQCHDWLDTHQAADLAPEPCPNRAVLERLKASQYAKSKET